MKENRFWDGIACAVFAFTNATFIDTFVTDIGKTRTHDAPFFVVFLTWSIVSLLWGFSFIRVLEIIREIFRRR